MYLEYYVSVGRWVRDPSVNVLTRNGHNVIKSCCGISAKSVFYDIPSYYLSHSHPLTLKQHRSWCNNWSQTNRKGSGGRRALLNLEFQLSLNSHAIQDKMPILNFTKTFLSFGENLILMWSSDLWITMKYHTIKQWPIVKNMLDF